MKSLAVTIVATLFLGTTICTEAQGEERWWQREVSRPSPSERMNPAYLRKKRELEQALDTLKRDIQAQKHFQSLGQRTPAINNAISSSMNTVNRLEYELSKIPQYLPLPPPPEPRIDQSVNVTPQTTVVLPASSRPEGSDRETPSAKSPTSPSAEPIGIKALQELLTAHGLTVRSVGELLLKLHTTKGNTVRIVPAQNDASACLFFEWMVPRDAAFSQELLDRIIKIHPSFRARIDTDPETLSAFVLVETTLDHADLSTASNMKLLLAEIDSIHQFLIENVHEK